MDMNQLKKIIVRRLLGEATPEELDKLEVWLKESEGNRDLLERLTSDVFLGKAITDENKDLRSREWKKLEQQTTGKGVRLRRLRWVKVAAAVLLPFAVGFAVWFLQGDPQSAVLADSEHQIMAGSSKAIVELAGGQQIYLNNDTTLNLEKQGIHLVSHKDTLNLVTQGGGTTTTSGYHVIRIPRGGEYIARLEDGTVVHLNSDSELKVPVDFGVKDRKIWLRGEAFFDVAHDKGKVFTVHTKKADVSVLGTEFDVRAYEEEQDVVTTLVQGAVEVKSSLAADRLKPGYQARVGESGKITTEKVDVYPFIAWKTGRMVFEDARLEQIMADLQRWYDFEVFYATPEVKEMRFTIDILKYDDISKVLGLMEKMEKVTFARKGRTIVLGSR